MRCYLRRAKQKNIRTEDKEKWTTDSKFRLPAINTKTGYIRMYYFDFSNAGAAYTVFLPYWDVKPIEQSTGLKDKTGRLIYEGDIVKFAINNPEEDYFYGVVRYSSENWKYEIVVGNETFCLCQVQGQDIEAIGNIHENPKLLEAEK